MTSCGAFRQSVFSLPWPLDSAEILRSEVELSDYVVISFLPLCILLQLSNFNRSVVLSRGGICLCILLAYKKIYDMHGDAAFLWHVL